MLFCTDSPDKVKGRPFQCSVCEQTFTIEASLDLDAEECSKCDKNLRTLTCKYIRFVLTGSPDGMSMDGIFSILGRNEVSRRINAYRDRFYPAPTARNILKKRKSMEQKSKFDV
jgi:hypothetical protein